MVITSLPYLYGWWLSTPQMEFSGFIVGVEDGYSYLAKMRMGAEGGWLFYLPYTPEPHVGAYVYTFYLLLGKVIFALGLSPVLGYHLARVLLGLGFLLTLYYFIAYFLAGIAERQLAFWLAATGSGLGWLLVAWPAVGLPLDFYVPEGFIFLVLLHLPHLALAESLLLGAMLLLLHGWRTGRVWPFAVGAGLALLLMSLVTPFYIAVFVAVMGGTWLGLILLEQPFPSTVARGREGERISPLPLGEGPGVRVRAARLLGLIVTVGMAVPVLLYDAYVFMVNPVMKAWSEQNIILSPAPWHYLFAYGLLMVPAIWGGRRLWREGDRSKILLPVVWCMLVPLLVYIPFNLQRRLVVGVQVPLTILAAPAMIERLGKRKVALVLCFSLTNLMLLAGGVVTVAGRHPPIFRPQTQVEAVEWLAGQTDDDVVLALYETGNILPAYANVRAFVGHGPETIRSDEKRAQAEKFFQADTPEQWRRDLLTQFNIRYVYYGPAEKGVGGFMPGGSSYLQERYRNEAVQIFEVLLEQ
jgi:hypothetical protein